MSPSRASLFFVAVFLNMGKASFSTAFEPQSPASVSFRTQALAEQQASSRLPMIAESAIGVMTQIGAAYANPNHPPPRLQPFKTLETYTSQWIAELKFHIRERRHILGLNIPEELKSTCRSILETADEKLSNAIQWSDALLASDDPWKFLAKSDPLESNEDSSLRGAKRLLGIEAAVLFVNPGSMIGQIFNVPLIGAVTIFTEHRGQFKEWVFVSQFIEGFASRVATLFHEYLHVRYLPRKGFKNNFDLDLHEGFTAWTTRETLQRLFNHGVGAEADEFRRSIHEDLKALQGEWPPTPSAQFKEWFSSFVDAYQEEIRLIQWIQEHYPEMDLGKIYQKSQFEKLYRTVPFVARLKKIGNLLFYTRSIFHQKELWRIFESAAPGPSAVSDEKYWRAATKLARWGHQDKGRLSFNDLLESAAPELPNPLILREGLEFRLQEKIYEKSLFQTLLKALTLGVKDALVLDMAFIKIRQILIDLVQSEIKSSDNYQSRPSNDPAVRVTYGAPTVLRAA
jgi:hypothetical protein